MTTNTPESRGVLGDSSRSSHWRPGDRLEICRTCPNDRCPNIWLDGELPAYNCLVACQFDLEFSSDRDSRGYSSNDLAITSSYPKSCKHCSSCRARSSVLHSHLPAKDAIFLISIATCTKPQLLRHIQDYKASRVREDRSYGSLD